MAFKQKGWQNMDCSHVTRDVGRWLDTLTVLVPVPFGIRLHWTDGFVTILLKDSGLIRRKEWTWANTLK